jgi:hypothetical protein
MLMTGYEWFTKRDSRTQWSIHEQSPLHERLMSLTVKHKEMGANTIIQLNKRNKFTSKIKIHFHPLSKTREDQIKLNTHH